MSFVHGRNTVVKLDDTDISKITNSTEWESEADTHDTTTYGKKSKTYAGGLLDGTINIEGIYDSDKDDGPRSLIQGNMGETVEFEFQPEGDGDDKPKHKVDVVVKSYKQTNEVADMIQWTAELQCTDDVDHKRTDDDD